MSHSDTLSVVVHIATPLIWVSFAIGEGPHVDRASRTLSELLRLVVPSD